MKTHGEVEKNMNSRGFDYKAQAISSMTPNELMFVLFDELVKRLMRAELALNKKDFPLFEASVQRSIEIVEYMGASLDMQYPISTDLLRLYEYFVYELGRAKIGRRMEQFRPVKEKIVDLRDTFRQAEKNANEGKTGITAQG